MTHLEITLDGAIEKTSPHFFRFFETPTSSALPKHLNEIMSSGSLDQLLKKIRSACEQQQPIVIATGFDFSAQDGPEWVPCEALVAIPSSTFPFVSQPYRPQTQTQPTNTISLFILPQHHSFSLQQGLLQNHKLVNVGALAAGVAHDLNNLFTGAMTFARMLKSKLEDPQQQGHLILIEKTLNRATHLSHEIINFLREDETTLLPMDPLGCIRDISYMVERTLSKEITLSLSLPSKGYPILIKRSELCQVILNLLVNARDAIKESGEIQVRSYFEPQKNPTFFTLKISDSGQGISTKEISKIFQPFYTTKGEAKGTGLGLSIVQKIIQERGGSVTVESNPEKPTCFTIRLPVVPQKKQSDTVSFDSVSKPTAP